MITGLDARAFYFLNKSCANPIFDRLMPFVTILGDGKFVLALAVLLVIIAHKQKRVAGVLILLGLAVSDFAVHFFKGIFARPRPFAALGNVHLLVKEMDKTHSFPSGHATLAFMVCVILANYFKRGYLFFIVAIAICFSRVYVGVHYVSDVIAGVIVGSLIGLALVYATRKLQK